MADPTPLRSPLLLRVVLRPIQVFFRLEAASGLLLLAAALLALAWANSPWAPLYHAVFEGRVTLGLGDTVARVPVHAIINDGLMTIFFFVVGMEIKRELVLGELRTFSQALLPAVAALGGMLVPALVFVALNAGTPGVRGWAIPMATDIAFSIGILTLLKGRVPHALVVFLTALAIFDDMGGILVIALFYGTGLEPGWLAAAAVVIGALVLLGRAGVRGFAPYLGLGALLWWTLHHGGIHATIAGVLLGLVIPARTRLAPRQVIEQLREQAGTLLAGGEASCDAEGLHALEDTLEELESPLTRLIHGLHPWVAFGIMPLFALANSGVDLSGVTARDLLAPVCLGAALGLFVGKQVGIFAFTWLAVKLGVSRMPGNARAAQLYGVSIIGGIGFTVALFIATLAFPEPHLLAQAKLGILLGSLGAGVVGYVVLRVLRVHVPVSESVATSLAG